MRNSSTAARPAAGPRRSVPARASDTANSPTAARPAAGPRRSGPERASDTAKCFALCLVLATSACSRGTSPEDELPLDAGFDETMEALRVEHELSALAVGVLRDGQLVHAGAYGIADRRTNAPAKVDSLFALASVSKVFVGLAIARAIELGTPLDLDADINTWLRWPTPLRHPDHPDTPITLRQLVRHESAIASDGPDDYDTYPKPDPTGSLDAFLKALLADPEYWTDTAPGEAEEYSNLGTALAALVVEKAVGRPFEDFCNAEVFGPLGMDDTRWFHRELDTDQRARLARPQGLDGPLEHYGFPDWPSGQLRSTIGDLARAIHALTRSPVSGQTLLGPANHRLFHETPLFIALDDGRYNHSGGESGVNTYLEYDTSGRGLIILTNQDLEDDALDAMFDEVTATLRRFSNTTR